MNRSTLTRNLLNFIPLAGKQYEFSGSLQGEHGQDGREHEEGELGRHPIAETVAGCAQTTQIVVTAVMLKRNTPAPNKKSDVALAGSRE